jgi:hypothetical protein
MPGDGYLWYPAPGVLETEGAMTADDKSKVGLTVLRIPLLILAALLVMLVVGFLIFNRG